MSNVAEKKSVAICFLCFPTEVPFNYISIHYVIPGVLIQAEGEILLSAIHKLINSVWNKKELPDQ
jgi:hypothetical protein